MEQLASATSVVPQALVPVEMVKSPGFVPAIVMPVMLSVALPVLESVAVCAAVVAPETAVKVSVAGVSETTGAGSGVPVPVNVADCVAGVALSVTVSVAVKLVAETGVNVT